MNISRRIFFGISLSSLAQATFAESLFYTKNDIAIDGYDPVAYFVSEMPIRGTSEYKSEYDGVTWHFSSAENKAMFDQDPTQYTPQYGGYCAWAAAKNSTAKSDPNAWTLHDGKLYLNYSTSVRDKWLQNIGENISKGDANWPALRQGLS